MTNTITIADLTTEVWDPTKDGILNFIAFSDENAGTASIFGKGVRVQEELTPKGIEFLRSIRPILNEQELADIAYIQDGGYEYFERDEIFRVANTLYRHGLIRCNEPAYWR